MTEAFIIIISIGFSVASNFCTLRLVVIRSVFALSNLFISYSSRVKAFTTLAPETRYSFRIKSYKKTGSAVVCSDYTNIAATTRIACVSGLTAKSSTVSSVTLSWNKVASATGYVVEIYKGGKWNTVLTTKNNTALSCKVTGLAAGSTYKARIKCYRLMT